MSSIAYEGICENCKSPIQRAGLVVLKDPAKEQGQGHNAVVWCANCVRKELLHPGAAD